MTHLFLFTLDPVQSFLAQARKAQDLYAGSLLISDLTRTAILAAAKEDIEVVFPNIDKCGESVPNRFIGVCNHVDAKKGQRIEAAVKTRWKEIANDALRNNVRKPAFFGKQIDSLLEIYWMFHAVKDDQNYFEACLDAERWFGALKNMRSNQVMLPEAGRKCSVDGVRNVRFYRCFPTETNLQQLMSAKLHQENNGKSITVFAHDEKFPGLPAILQPGEGLSAVSFVKRRFEADKVRSFQSTAAIALMEDTARVIDLETTEKWEGGAKAYRAFKSVFERRVDYFDEQLFYEENLTKRYLNKYGYSEVTKREEDWKEVTNNHLILQGWLQQKYYAILMFDGDYMGDLVGGRFLKDKSQSSVQRFQRVLSELLGDFAIKARNLLDIPKGRAIYAGGDDFLGFVNLYHLLPLLCDLRERFHEDVNQPLQKQFDLVDASGTPFYFSFSAGVAVAHYKIPLNIVLKEARAAEKRAKLSGRNALSLTVLKHSGETHQSSMSWSDTSETNPAAHARLLTKFFEGLQNGYSDQFIRALQMETERLHDGFFQNNAMGNELLSCEIRRLVVRARPKDIDKEVAEKWASEVVFPLFSACGHDFNVFMDMLMSIHFLHQKMPVRS